MRTFLFVCCLLLLVASPVTYAATTYYVSPSGTGTSCQNAETAGQAYNTIRDGLDCLNPGDTLILRNGTYTPSTTGMLINNCSTQTEDGTALLPITVRAENERQAHLSSEGRDEAIHLVNCSWWILEGLRASSADLASGSGGADSDTVWIQASDNVILKKLVVDHNNRYFNVHLIDIFGSTNVLVEDSEAYYFHRHAFFAFNSTDVTFRRLYCNSRDYADLLVGGTGSNDDVRGDDCVAFYPASASIAENIVSEGQQYMVAVEGAGIADDNSMYGSISLNDASGGHCDSRIPGDTPNNFLMEHVAIINPSLQGFYHRGCNNSQFNNVLVYSAGSNGIIADGGQPGWEGTNPSIFATNTNVVSSGSTGFSIVDQSAFGLNFINAFGNATDFSPPASHASITNETTTDPALGTCYAWVPASSPMSGTGLSGADIGANILYRYENGGLTEVPLWDTTTGAFPCGATVSGLSDTAGNSCINVHERLNINSGGCAFPAGFAAGIAFLADPSTLSVSGNTALTLLGNPSGLAISGNAALTPLGNPSGLSLSGNTALTLLNNPSGLTLP